MKRLAILSLMIVSAGLILLPVVTQQPARGQQTPQPPPVKPTAEETRQIQSKVEEIEAAVRALKAKRVGEHLVADVEVYAKAGKFLLEMPDDFFTRNGINHALAVLDTGIERARQLQAGDAPWMKERKQTHGYYSAIDGSVQPYGVTIPASYDASKPARLYVWLHGRANTMNEAEFLHNFLNQRTGVADNGQIQLDVYGRWNSAGYHWAGEADIFEAIAAVQKRYNIDPKRILLRGFSMGGEGAWHLALHYPDRWAAAEIGAGTWSRRASTPGLEPYQLAVLHIWENMPEWALTIYNLPLAGHDGETDGQLESSLRTRAQLEKEGFPSEGEPDFLHSKGAPGLWMFSRQTGHGTSPLVRERLDAFLKEYGDRGQVSPDHIRFVTWTTRYNRDYWTSVEGLEKTYERAEIDAERREGGRQFQIATKNITRLTMRETDHAADIKIDGEDLHVKPAAEITLAKTGGAWRVDRRVAPGRQPGLHKIHALQGPIDDAFLDPFLLVRPTGKPWHDAVNEQVLRTLARFDRLWAKWLRGHPRIVDDKDVTEADFAKYNVVLFGDPGSNKWIAKMNGKLPVRWTKDTVTMGGQTFAAGEHFPALCYPNPLHPSRYVVLNTGLTISERDYRGDYGMPLLGDYAVLKVKDGAEIADTAVAGLFDESWQLPK